MSGPRLQDEFPTRELDSATLEEVPDRQVATGRKLDRYAVLQPLGRGGMGEVVRAYDERLQREVALKILHRHTEPESRARIVREAQAMAKMSHPNVVGVYDVHEAKDGMLFIAMELVVGETLAAWLRRARRDWTEVVEVFVQAARGLAAAHAEGLVHRDFKPANVLIGSDGRVRVTDFGIARLEGVNASVDQDDVPLQPTDELTREGTVVGTPAYMAPEQHGGAALDARTDQYAFCVALYEAAARRRPFASTDPKRLLELKRSTSPKWPNTLPAWLGHVVLRGLSVEPSDRWPSMAEIIAALSPKPPRWPKIAMGVGAATVFGVAVAAVASNSEADCGTQQERVAKHWDAETAASVRAGLTADAGAFGQETAAKVETAMEAWAQDWATEHLAACRGQGGMAAAVQVLRTACLERRRERFAGLTEQFIAADADVRQAAVKAVASLPPPSACGDPKLLAGLAAPPSNPDDAVVAASIEAEIERVRALLSTGRLESAQATLQKVLARARALDHPPVTGTALWLSGSTTSQLGELESGVAQMREAFQVLTAARAHHDAAKVAITLARTVGNAQREIAAARVWATTASAGFDAYGATEYEHASLQDTLGVLALLSGEADEAVAFHERSVALQGGNDGASSPELSGALSGLAASLQTAGRYDDARAMFGRALDMAGRELGPLHPEVALLHNNLGVLEATVGNAEQALLSYDRALEIRREVLGVEHPTYAGSLSNSAQALFTLGKYDEAKKRSSSALRSMEAALGPEHPDVGVLVNQAAVIHDAAGDAEQAEALFRRSVKIIETQLGADHPSLVPPLLGLGKYALNGADAEAALAIAERIDAIYEGREGNPIAQSSARFLFARARWALGQRSLARQDAQAALTQLDGPAPDLAARREPIERWLTEHPATE